MGTKSLPRIPSRRSATPGFVLSLVLASQAWAQDVRHLQDAVREYADADTFAGAVLVAEGDQVLVSAGYGAADREWGVMNSPQTKFRIGSLTKQFTAAAILLLEERGQLSLSDRVKQHMPEAPPAWNDVTIHHLLTHTAGIPNFTSFPEYEVAKFFPATAAHTIEMFRRLPLPSRRRATAPAVGSRRPR